MLPTCGAEFRVVPLPSIALPGNTGGVDGSKCVVWREREWWYFKGVDDSHLCYTSRLKGVFWKAFNFYHLGDLSYDDQQ